MAVHNLNSSLPAMTNNASMSRKDGANFRAWLSAAITQVQICRDTFPRGGAREIAASHFRNSIDLMTTGLSILSQIENANEDLEEEDGEEKEEERLSVGYVGRVVEKGKGKPNVVVAADGSGKYRTISEAINAAPSKSKTRFVIYVKKGVYKENVVIPFDKTNVMLYGDGMGATIITSNRNTITNGIQTPDTATVKVMGNGFIAMDMTFQNSAGPNGGQAVALLSCSDQSALYRCRIDGHQDSLWAASSRQFYRECEILGTVDFIFGNAAVVIQQSNILVRRPKAGQYNTMTAQGKENPETHTGTIIQDCNISGVENLGGVKTYLGRPWKPYSTTTIMGSTIGGCIDSTGWCSWEGKVPNTIFYGEYDNKGPGASTAKRVKWSGYKKLSANEASKFTVRSFINGDQWLPATGVPFKADL